MRNILSWCCIDAWNTRASLPNSHGKEFASLFAKSLHSGQSIRAKTDIDANSQQGDPFIVGSILLQFKSKCKYKI
jgi:hypothetical protein